MRYFKNSLRLPLVVYVFKALPSCRGAKNFWVSSSAHRLTRKVVRGREGGRKERLNMMGTG
jgi:hypothetical protein